MYTISSHTCVSLSALVLSPAITSTCQQGVLQLNCTADKPLSVVPPLMFSWFRSSVGNGTFSPLDPGLPGINVSRTPSGSNTSTLSIAGSSVSGNYVYLCMAVVAVPDDAPVAANVTSGVMNFSICKPVCVCVLSCTCDRSIYAHAGCELVCILAKTVVPTTHTHHCYTNTYPHLVTTNTHNTRVMQEHFVTLAMSESYTHHMTTLTHNF